MNWEKFDKNVDIDELNKDIEESAANGNGNYEDVPNGNYEVKVDKLELKESKKGDIMVSAWFKILNGRFKNSYIFYNQVIKQGFQIHLANELLRSLDSGIDVPSKFNGYAKYNDMVLDIAEKIETQKLEYELKYGENKKGFKTFEIVNVFEN